MVAATTTSLRGRLVPPRTAHPVHPVHSPGSRPGPGRAAGHGRLYQVARHLTAPLRDHWLDVSVHGAANVPERGGVVIAANHLSFLDSMLIMYALDRPVGFLGKAEYLRRPVTRLLFPATGMIPVDRSGRGVARSLRLAQGRLVAGGIVGIFPEGTRSRDGRLHRGHTGVAHLALRTGAPIVPAGIVGTDAALPPDARLPVRGAPITIRFGAPIGPPPLPGGRRTATARRALTDEVMASIASLSGQAYVDEYHPVSGTSTGPAAAAPAAAPVAR